MPVPLEEAGFRVGDAGFVVDGLEYDASVSGLTKKVSRSDRELGGVAQYELRFSRPPQAIEALGEDPRPFVVWVTQVVVLLTDPDAAAQWFKAKSRAFKGYEGREIDGFLYRSVVIDPLVALADEAAVVVAETEDATLAFLEVEGVRFVDTYVNFRRGRLFAGVGASTYKELDVRTPLTELAKVLLSRIDGILAENQG